MQARGKHWGLLTTGLLVPAQLNGEALAKWNESMIAAGLELFLVPDRMVRQLRPDILRSPYVISRDRPAALVSALKLHPGALRKGRDTNHLTRCMTLYDALWLGHGTIAGLVEDYRSSMRIVGGEVVSETEALQTEIYQDAAAGNAAASAVVGAMQAQDAQIVSAHQQNKAKLQSARAEGRADYDDLVEKYNDAANLIARQAARIEELTHLVLTQGQAKKPADPRTSPR